MERLLNAGRIFFRKEYVFYYSVLFFILLASLYIYFDDSRFKVSYAIHINQVGVPADTIFTRIRSKDLVRKTIDHLPFEVNYYWERAPHKEIFGDSLPVKIIGNSPVPKLYEGDLHLHSLSSHFFSTDHEDTVQFYEFGEPVKDYYGDFKVVKAPAFKSHFDPLVIRFNQPEKLIRSFYQHLSVDSDTRAGGVRLSVITTNPLKGQAFLDELIKQYNAANLVPAKSDRHEDSLMAVEQKLALLKSYRRPAALPGPDKQQMKLLGVIKPYVDKPVRQFVQVPYIDEVENKSLKTNLEKFNKAELDKQHFLASGKIDDVAIAHADRELKLLRTEILDQINQKSPGLAEERSLKRYEIRYKKLITSRPSTKRSTKHDAILVTGKQGTQVSITGVNFFVIYMGAIVLGLLLPLVFAFFVNLDLAIIRGEWFNSHTLTEKVKMLFGISRSTDA